MTTSMKKKRKHPISNYFINHIRSLCFAFGEIQRAPIANCLTIVVIAIALVLPCGLYRVLKSLQPIGAEISAQPQIAIYTKTNISNNGIQELHQALQKIPNVSNLTYISPQQGLKQFIQYSKLDGILDSVGQNPLPAVFSLTPTFDSQSPLALSKIVTQIKLLPNVGLVQLNMTWLKRLYYLIRFSQRIVIALGIIFFIGVILIVGNTIRLITQRHQEDINIMRLFGAKPGFIRRPLLYRGILLGLFGGVIAWLMIAFFLWWLAAPLEALARSYSNTLIISSFTLSGGAFLALSGMILAGAGAWFAVAPYLRQAEE